LAREFNILSHHVTQPPGMDQNGSFSGENWVFMADASALTPADQELLCRLLVKTAPPAPLIAINASGKATSPLLRRASAVAPSSGEIPRQFVYTVLNWHRRHIPRSASPQPPAYRESTILVADDNDMNRRVIAQMLRLDGYAVLEANSGDDA